MVEQAGIVGRGEVVLPRRQLAVAEVLLLGRRTEIAGEQGEAVAALKNDASAANGGVKVGVSGDQGCGHRGRCVEFAGDLGQTIGVEAGSVVLLAEAVVVVDEKVHRNFLVGPTEWDSHNKGWFCPL